MALYLRALEKVYNHVIPKNRCYIISKAVIVNTEECLSSFGMTVFLTVEFLLSSSFNTWLTRFCLVLKTFTWLFDLCVCTNTDISVEFLHLKVCLFLLLLKVVYEIFILLNLGGRYKTHTPFLILCGLLYSSRLFRNERMGSKLFCYFVLFLALFSACSIFSS